jgi:glc operon protein GlcG
MVGLIKQKATLTLEAAKLVASRAAQKAEELCSGGAIAIADHTGNLIYLERLDGTMPAAAEIAAGKASTVVMFQRSTIKLENLVQNQRLTMLGLGNVVSSPYTPLMGGQPLVFNGEIIGAVAVAGAGTGENDEIISSFAAKCFEEELVLNSK